MSAPAQKPALSEDDIRRGLQGHFSIGGRLEPLPGECDLNYKLTTEDGEIYVCKISSGSDDLGLLAAQNDVMRILRNEV